MKLFIVWLAYNRYKFDHSADVMVHLGDHRVTSNWSSICWWSQLSTPSHAQDILYIKCVTFYYVLLLFGHNLVKNSHKSDLFRPKILKWFLYKPNQSVLRYLYISRKIFENTKKQQIWVLPFICTDTIKSTEKYLFLLFCHF